MFSGGKVRVHVLPGASPGRLLHSSAPPCLCLPAVSSHSKGKRPPDTSRSPRIGLQGSQDCSFPTVTCSFGWAARPPPSRPSPQKRCSDSLSSGSRSQAPRQCPTTPLARQSRPQLNITPPPSQPISSDATSRDRLLSPLPACNL